MVHSSVQRRVLRVLVLMFAVMAILVGAVSAASALTFSGEVPAKNAVFTSAPTGIWLNASAAAAVVNTKSLVLVDGKVRYCNLVYPWGPGGHWENTLVWDEEAEEDYWELNWVLDQDLKNPQVFVSGLVPSTDGTHTIAVTLRTITGTTATDSWQYAVRIAPKLGDPVPAAGSLLSTLTPTITIPATDNSAVATWTVTINDKPASATLVAGKLQITPLSPLENDATAVVKVSIADALGIRVDREWSYPVQIYSDMDSGHLASCQECHVGYSATHNKADDCWSCHGEHHGDTATQMHAMSDVSACKPCHVSSLSVEHNRYLLNCLTCHESSRPEVTAAVRSGDTRCSACHVGAGHIAQHAKSNSAFCAKSGCHEATNLVGEHIVTPIKSGAGMSCDTCHRSTNPTVVAAIAAKSKDCTTCHGQMLSGHDRMHESVMAPECLQCHAGSVSAEHIVLHNTGGARTCSTCHDSTEPRIVTAITEGDLTCGGCHADAGHEVGHSADFAAQDCGDCHQANLEREHFRATSSSVVKRCANCHNEPKSTQVDALGGTTWNRGCAQGTCHPADTPVATHGAMGAAHAVATPAPSCIAADCHSGSDLSVMHSSASTVAAGVTRTGCGVCHSATSLPASGDCVSCHPERTAAHGYDALKHTATTACFGACHSQVLGATHSGGCQSCHATKVATIKPWNKTCSACHATVSHTTATAKHVGTDVVETCAGIPANGQAGCHDITSLSTLHIALPDSGCTVCHGAGKTPKRECRDCHATSWTGDWYGDPGLGYFIHHNNRSFLNDQADANGEYYYLVDPTPAGGYYDAMYYQKCYDLCHRDGGYNPPFDFSAYQGKRMWYSVAGDSNDSVPTRTLALKSVSLPAGSPSMQFMTRYGLGAGDAGYVEVSTNGGSSWTALTGTVGGISKSVLTGTNGAWQSAVYDLSAYAGQTVKIRFRYVNGPTSDATGWAFDNLVISAGGTTVFADNAETITQDWDNYHWTRAGRAMPTAREYRW